MKAYYVYMLECSNGHYYIGYTTDIERRYQEHREGSSKCKYTRSFPPKRIVMCWTVNSLSQALKLERYLKKLSRDEKSHLTTVIPVTSSEQ